MNFFKTNKEQLKSEFHDRTLQTDRVWASTLVKDRRIFFIIIIVYACLAYLFFPKNPEIYLGVGIPLFYLCWLVLINFIDNNRFLEQVSNSSTANLAHKYSSDKD